MNSRLALLAAAGALALTAQASAAEPATATVDTYLAITGTAAGEPAGDRLTPHEPRALPFGSGIAFVVYEPDEDRTDRVQVVTTVVTDAATVLVRFVAHLTPGQETEISVADPDADAAGLATPRLRIGYDQGVVTLRPDPRGQVEG